MRALLVLMAMDYFAGLMVAAIKGELCARIGWRGLVKKSATLLVILATSIAQSASGRDWGVDNVLILGFVANELLSVIRNCVSLGAPIPPEAMDRIESVRKLLRPAKKQPASITSAEERAAPRVETEP